MIKKSHMGCFDHTKKITVFLTACIFCMMQVIFSCTAYSFERTSSRNVRSQAGYINASKTRTDSILAQTEDKKSFMDKISAFLSRATKSKRDHSLDRTNRPLNIKKKRSSSLESIAEKTTPEVVGTVIELPSDNLLVDKAVKEISNSTGVDASCIAYEMLENGNAVFIWKNDEDLYARMYNEGGTVLDGWQNVAIGLADTGTGYKLAGLRGGGFAIGVDNGIESNFATFDESGLKSSFSIDNSGGSLQSMTGLTNGRFAAAWQNGGTFTNNQGSYFRIMEANGLFSGKHYLPQTNARAQAQSNVELTTLTNGDIVATWDAWGQYGFFNSFVTVYGQDDFSSPKTSALHLSYRAREAKVQAIGGNKFVVSWVESSKHMYINVFDSDGVSETGNMRIYSFNDKDHDYYAPRVAAFDDGSFAAVFGDYKSVKFNKPNYHFKHRGYYMRTFSNDGIAITNTVRISDSKYHANIDLDPLDDGTLAIRWYNIYTDEWVYNQYNTTGTERDVYGMLAPMTSENILEIPSDIKQILEKYVPKKNALEDSILSSYQYEYSKRYIDERDSFVKGHERGYKDIKTVVTDGMLKNGDARNEGIAADLLTTEDIVADIVKSALTKSALSIPLNDLKTNEGRHLLVLKNALERPTEDQKFVLDVMKALIDMIAQSERLEHDKSVEQTEKKLINSVAQLILTQAVPDLFTGNSMNEIKDLFADLRKKSGDIAQLYTGSIQTYYEAMIAEIAKNIQVSEISSILKKNIFKQELVNLSRSEVNRIIDELNKKQLKTENEKNLLKIAGVLRTEYIEKAGEAFSVRIKHLMTEFTKGLQGKLGEIKTAKK